MWNNGQKNSGFFNFHFISFSRSNSSYSEQDHTSVFSSMKDMVGLLSIFWKKLIWSRWYLELWRHKNRRKLIFDQIWARLTSFRIVIFNWKYLLFVVKSLRIQIIIDEEKKIQRSGSEWPVNIDIIQIFPKFASFSQFFSRQYDLQWTCSWKTTIYSARSNS